MKVILLSFCQIIYLMKKNLMLFVVIVNTIVMGAVFKYIVPIIDNIIQNYTGKLIISPYYVIFDLFFSMITPMTFCFVSAMIILEEFDDNTINYLFITPLRKRGYLISHIIIPALLSFSITIIIFPIFKLTNLSISQIFILSITGALFGIIHALSIASLSKNKVEGMIIGKLLIVFIPSAAIIPFFINNNLQYIASFIPSFWIAKGVYNKNNIYFTVSIILSFIWIYLINKKFENKIL